MNESDPQKRPGFVVRVLRVAYRMGRFFFAAIGVFVTVVPIVLLSMLLDSGKIDDLTSDAPKASVPEKVVLEMQLGGAVAETAPDARFQLVNRLMGARGHVYLPDLIKVLARAGADARVQGLRIQIEDLRASPAAITELRQALSRFQDSGKKLTFHLTEADTDAYYLATAGQTIELTPAGSLEVPGPVFQMMYMSSALSKLGVEFQVVRAGKYKSAFEPLIADAPSPATIEMMSSMEESLRGHIAETIGPARKTDAEQARKWMKRGLFTADDALAAGMVDKLSYASEHESRFREDAGASASMKFSKYGSATRDDDPSESITAPSERIGVIEAEGEMVMYDDDTDSGGVITPRRLAKAFRWARADDDIKAVVFRISSPGGSAIAADLIWKEVRKTAKLKPVVVSMGAAAASGGYYVAAPASRILAEPTTITGSIGVLAGLPKLTGFSQKWGLSFHTITQTDRAGLYSASRLPSREDQELLADHVDHTYDMFVQKVAQGRGLDRKKVYALAEGRVYTGLEAHALGLVDQLGGFTDAVTAAVELAKLDPTRTYPIKRYGYERNVFECLRSLSSFEDCVADGDTSLSLDVTMVPQLTSLVRVFEKERVLLRLPFLLTSN